MSHLFAPEAPVSLTIHGSDQTFPVRRVYCVGRNYAAHAREMGFDPEREPPFFFCKPADAVVPVAAGSTWSWPTRARPATTTTRSNWWRRSARAAATSPGAGRGTRLGLRGGPGHDPPRPADAHARDGPALGDRQGLRPLGADRPALPCQPGRPSAPRRHQPPGRRRGSPAQRHRPVDLVGGGNRQLPVALLRAAPRRPGLHRHPGRRRRGRARRADARRHRRPRRTQRPRG